MTITSYFGLKPCCDCGRTGNYTINKNGYQFTVCSDCLHNYTDVEEEENETDNKCNKCGKKLSLENMASVLLTSYPPKYLCKECAGGRK